MIELAKPKNVAYAIDWTEYECGFGCRPDGRSFHASRTEATQYVTDYWAKMPNEVPHEYSRPGDVFEVELTDASFAELQIKRNMWG